MLPKREANRRSATDGRGSALVQYSPPADLRAGIALDLGATASSPVVVRDRVATSGGGHGELRQPLPLDVRPLRHHPPRECPGDRSPRCFPFAFSVASSACTVNPCAVLTGDMQRVVLAVLGEEDVVVVGVDVLGELRVELHRPPSRSPACRCR